MWWSSEDLESEDIGWQWNFRLTEAWFNDDKVELLCPRESLIKTEEEICKPRRPIKITVQSKVKIQNEKFLWTWMTKSAGKRLWNPPDNASKFQRVEMMVNAPLGEEEDFQGNGRIQRSVNEDRWKSWRQWNFAKVAVRESSWALAKKLYQGCCPGRLMKTVKEMPYQSFDLKKMAKNDDMTDEEKAWSRRLSFNLHDPDARWRKHWMRRIPIKMLLD